MNISSSEVSTFRKNVMDYVKRHRISRFYNGLVLSCGMVYICDKGVEYYIRYGDDIDFAFWYSHERPGVVIQKFHKALIRYDKEMSDGKVFTKEIGQVHGSDIQKERLQ